MRIPEAPGVREQLDRKRLLPGDTSLGVESTPLPKPAWPARGQLVGRDEIDVVRDSPRIPTSAYVGSNGRSTACGLAFETCDLQR
ncbi:MAG: hypothetical protein MUQ10_00315, partial [Anaerolineae bacterium]|nr:hypothetical protein [Anaerolineae bacterium]